MSQRGGNENVKDDLQVSSWYSWVAAGPFTDMGKWEEQNLRLSCVKL